MIETFLAILNALPPELSTALLASTPVGELRLAMPIAISVYKMHPAAAFAYSYLGNVIPLIVIYTVLPGIIKYAARHSPRLNDILNRYFLHLERKYKDRYDRYGRIILLLFVAIPIPGSGVWTASILAILFGVETAYAVPAILVGLAISAGIILTITQVIF
jgi:uncharacterized membrane protein